jgi:transcription elongation factor Elf1
MNDNVKQYVPIAETMKYYTHAFYCDNCNERNVRYITLGIKIKDISFACSNCGCVINGKKEAHHE